MLNLYAQGFVTARMMVGNWSWPRGKSEPEPSTRSAWNVGSGVISNTFRSELPDTTTTTTTTENWDG